MLGLFGLRDVAQERRFPKKTTIQGSQAYCSDGTATHDCFASTHSRISFRVIQVRAFVPSVVSQISDKRFGGPLRVWRPFSCLAALFDGRIRQVCDLLARCQGQRAFADLFTLRRRRHTSFRLARASIQACRQIPEASPRASRRTATESR